MALIMQLGAAATSDSVRWISGNGNDGNDGCSQITAMRSLASAYASLPSTGGTIYALPGLYDQGVGFNGTVTKLVHVIGLVKPTRVIGSASTTPISLSSSAAVFYSTANPVNLITFTAGTPRAAYYGLKFVNLVFQISGSSMLYALDLPNACRSEVSDCLFFADKTTDPAPVNGAGVWFHNDGTASSDSSWNRVIDCEAVNTAIAQFGNPAALSIPNSNNGNVAFANVCQGLSRTNTSCLAAVSFIGGHRCVARDNQYEGYQVGEFWDHCYGCSSHGSGGEAVQIFIDLVSTHGCYFQPTGISYAQVGSSTPKFAGAMLVRGDAFTKRNVFDVSATADPTDTNGLYKPVDDATNPAFSINGAGLVGDNVINSPRYSYDPMRAGGTSTTTPGAVTTVNIAHGLPTTPLKYSAQAANTNAATALTTRSFFVSVDATNVILTFGSALTAATSYAWAWTADAR